IEPRPPPLSSTDQLLCVTPFELSSLPGGGPFFLRKERGFVDWQHLFVAWGIAWWVLTLALVAGSFALVACKRGAYFLLSLVVYLGLLQFLGNTPVLEFIQKHILAIAGVGAGFLGIGVVWFNWRWHWLTGRMRNRYNEVFAAWSQRKG